MSELHVPDGIEMHGTPDHNKFRGHAEVFRTNEPISDGEEYDVFDTITSQWWVVTSINIGFANETAIFACNEDGEPTNWNDVVCVRPRDMDEALREFSRRYLD